MTVIFKLLKIFYNWKLDYDCKTSYAIVKMIKFKIKLTIRQIILAYFALWAACCPNYVKDFNGYFRSNNGNTAERNDKIIDTEAKFEWQTEQIGI